jgi:excisionase family DNA binding protein
MAKTTATPYLTTSQVAGILHVSPKTVSRWAKEGRLPHQKTLGGHRRYPERQVRELAENLKQEVTAVSTARRS